MIPSANNQILQEYRYDILFASKSDDSDDTWNKGAGLDALGGKISATCQNYLTVLVHDSRIKTSLRKTLFYISTRFPQSVSFSRWTKLLIGSHSLHQFPNTPYASETLLAKDVVSTQTVQGFCLVCK
jgi:hypothetical protein